MMPKTVPILVSLCVMLICKISFATENQIELVLLNPNQVLLPQNNITKIDNFLIYPKTHAFQYFILPWLDSKAVIQAYGHFKISYPKLDLCKWLECCETSTVQDFKETKTLYYTNQNIPSVFNTILYSENSKTAIIPEVVSPEIKPNKICALLLSNQIFPFEEKQLLSNEIVWVARNSNNFFIALKTSDNSFTPVARGNLHKMNFNKDLEFICNVHNLKGAKKFLVTSRYFFTIPFLKYFEYISPHLGKIFNKLKDYTWFDFGNINVFNFVKLIIFRILWIILCYIHAGLEYHIFILPFHVLNYILSSFKLETSFFVICMMPLFFTIIFDRTIFPQNIIIHLLNKTIKNDLRGKLFLAKDSEIFLTFDIEPKNTMWVLSFVVERPKGRKELLLFWFAILFSFFFKFWIPNWFHI